MKVYIVFLGLLIVHVNFMSYNQDLGRYIMLQNFAKVISEECAAQAALLLDEEEFYKDHIIFSKEEADSERVLKTSCNRLGIIEGYTLDLKYEDDSSSYDIENEDRNPRVTATISIDVSSLFNTAFFEDAIITRSSCYEIL